MYKIDPNENKSYIVYKLRIIDRYGRYQDYDLEAQVELIECNEIVKKYGGFFIMPSQEQEYYLHILN